MKTSFFPFILLFSIVFCKCNTFRNSTDEDMIISLEKTSCMGECPVFSLKIASGGTVIYEGIKYVDKIGRYRSKLNSEQLKSLTDKFDKADFFNFKDVYSSLYKDLPTKFISYRKNGRLKRIKAYDNIPKEIKLLINELDNLISVLEWKKMSI